MIDKSNFSLENLPVDEAHRERARKDFTTNFWVEAGAGTGKTRLLIERLYYLVVQEGVSLEEVAAITFTEKAASELKIRLREKLEEQKKVSTGPLLRRIEAALQELEYAPLGTIHSFAASLLRERPVEARVDPRFEILDQSGMETLGARAWDSWFTDQLEQEREPLRRAIKFGFRPDDLRTLAFKIYSEREILEQGRSYPASYSPRECLEKLREPLSLLKQLMQDCKETSDEGFQQITRFLEWFSSADKQNDEDLTYSFLQLMPELKKKGKQENWFSRESCREQKKLAGEINEMQQDILVRASGGVMEETLEWLKEFFPYLEEEKLKRGVLDFNDLLLKARDLVKKHNEARGYFQRRFRYLLVDEFQDTDPLQAEIIMFLSESAPLAGTWDQVKLQPGKLFLVGDPKQSIYRFRRADIQMYDEVRQCLLQQQGEELYLVQNFRTLPQVITWVNQAFEHLIQPVPDRSYQPRYVPLDPYRRESRQDIPPILFYHPPEESREYSADELRRMEARWLSASIKDMVGCQEIVLKDGSTRTLDYSDVAVLFPTTTGIYHYEDALQQLHIPYRLEGGKLLFQRSEINHFIALVAALDNPYDQVALVSTLRNVFGVSDEEIFYFVHQGGRLDYLHEKEQGLEKLPPVIDHAFRVLEELYRAGQEACFNSVTGYLEEALEKTGFLKWLRLQQRSRQAISNLKKMLDLARSWEKKDPLTLRQFLGWLRESKEQEKEESESLIPEGEAKAVTLLTVHRSKGLEFPVVVLANLISGQNRSPSLLVDRRHSRYELKAGGQVSFATCGFSELREDEKARQEAEKRRLFYVAVTRAENCLMIPLTRGRRSQGYWNYLSELDENHRIPEYARVEMETNLEKFPKSLPSEDQEEATEKEDNQKSFAEELTAVDWLKRRQRWKEELSELVTRQAESTPAYTASGQVGEVDEKDKEREVSSLDRPVARGASLGSAYHQVMEKVSLKPESSEVYRLVEEASRYWGLEQEAADELGAMVQKTLKSSLWKRIEGIPVYREVPFSVYYGGKILEGLVDLLFQEGESLVLVDYKTDYLDKNDVESRRDYYLPQAYGYALALEHVTGKRIKEVSFYFVRPDVIRQVPLKTREEMEDELFNKSTSNNQPRRDKKH